MHGISCLHFACLKAHSRSLVLDISIPHSAISASPFLLQPSFLHSPLRRNLLLAQLSFHNNLHLAFPQLIESLAVESEDRCLMAGRCLGELVSNICCMKDSTCNAGENMMVCVCVRCILVVSKMCEVQCLTWSKFTWDSCQTSMYGTLSDE
jgi:hypothetical protein